MRTNSSIVFCTLTEVFNLVQIIGWESDGHSGLMWKSMATLIRSLDAA